MPNDHFVAEVMTKPWVLPGRELRVFDFLTREFRTVPMRRLFARKGLNSPEVEQWLGETIDDPIGKVVQSVRAGDPPPTDLTWPEMRAIAMLFLFQAQRSAEGRGEVTDFHTLEQVMCSGEYEQLAQAFHTKREIAWVSATPGTELLFTEAVLFVHPFFPAPPVLMIPMGLTAAIVAQDRAYSMSATLDALHATNLVTGFSMGIGTNVHRIILPPSWSGESVTNPDQCRAELLELRGLTRRYIDTLAGASSNLGLRPWAAT